jgi:hypothetical protein
MAFSNTSSLNGLSQIREHPAFIACTEVGTPPITSDEDDGHICPVNQALLEIETI